MGWIGGLLLTAAGAGMGWHFACRLRRRVTFLETCGRLMQTLWQDMSYTAQPMGELWRRLAQNEAFAAFPLVRDTADALTSAPFSDAFAAALKKAETEGVLLPADRLVLTEFGEGCGRTDLSGQQVHITYYRDRLSQREEEARRTYEEKGRVYRVLGLTGGLALTLLLM
jgi:stage III sporulation protein AB